MCGQRRSLDAIQVYIQTDGHLESALHVLVNVSGVLVKLNSKNSENIEVSARIMLLRIFKYLNVMSHKASFFDTAIGHE